MASITRRAGIDLTRFLEIGADPASAADELQLYTKDATGVTQLFARDSAGTVHQITPPGGVTTLDAAYDGGGAGAGRTITVDSGAVLLDADVADATPALDITREPAASAAIGIRVVMGVNTSGHGLSITQNGSGDAINVTGDVTVTGKLTVTGLIDPTGIKITEQAVDPGSTGAGFGTFWVRNDAPSVPMFTNDVGTDTVLGPAGGATLDTAYDGGRTITVDAGAVILDADAATATPALDITREPTAVAAIGIRVVMGANATGAGLNISHSGTGNGLTLANSGGADAINIALSSSTASQALVVVDSSASTQDLVSLTRSTTAATGIILDIEKSPGGVTTGALVRITSGANASGTGIHIVNGGSGEGILIEQNGADTALSLSLTDTSAKALVITDTVAGTDTLFTMTRSTTSASGVMLLMTKAPGGATGGNMITMSNAANTTANAIGITQNGSGDAINIAMGSSTTAQAIVITESIVGTADMVSLTRSGGSGDMLTLTKSPGGALAGSGIDITYGSNATGNLIDLNQSGTGDAINIALTTSTTGQALVVTDSTANTVSMVSLTRSTTAATGNLLNLTKSPGGATAGDLVSITAGANASGNCIAFAHDGTGDAINIALATSTTGQALVVTDATANTVAMVEMTRSTTAATGVMLSLTKSPGGATAGNLVSITAGANASGDAINISHTGTGFAINAIGALKTDQNFALGGGAAPTFGTIGATGPAAAAQNEWIKITTAAGARFVPAWA